MSTVAIENLDVLETKSDAQRFLRSMGLTGLTVDAIDVDRIYVLTGKKLQQNGQMEREAHTVVLGVGEEDGMAALVVREQLPGWVVPA